MKLRFEEITKDNWRRCAHLSVNEDQRDFVAPNWYSMLEAKFEADKHPFCVYDGDEMIGFLMYGIEEETNTWGLDRLMIDKKFQHLGYGRAIMEKMLAMLKEQLGSIAFYTSYEPTNIHAKKLYKEFGFIETGRIVDGEEEVVLQL